jgi:hypothetical protein
LFVGLTWEQYLDLPGAPRHINPYVHRLGLSKCDVLVYYRDTRQVEAITREREQMVIRSR